MDHAKQCKRNDDPKAYWQLYFVIFTAFFVDHSQNEFLQQYFNFELKAHISNLKHALDIVQSLLQKSQITEQVFEIAHDDVQHLEFNN